MAQPRVAIVSRRERQVVGELTRDGATNQQIAARLGISEGTVKTHVKRILAACKCRTRTEVVVALLRRQIVIRTVIDRRTMNTPPELLGQDAA